MNFSDLKPLRPTLYRLGEDGHSLIFFHMRCEACGRLNFPANLPGCGQCGHALTDAPAIERQGLGKLLEFVEIHVPLFPGMQVPCITGDIFLAEDIVREGVIEVPDATVLREGMALRAIAAPSADGTTFTCRFVPDERGDSP